MHAKVDDNPTCDSCARMKCCKEILACDSSSSCKAVQNCFAKCANDDQVCQLACASMPGDGPDLLGNFANCLQDKCPSECPANGGSDAGFDAF